MIEDREIEIYPRVNEKYDMLIWKISKFGNSRKIKKENWFLIKNSFVKFVLIVILMV